MRYDTVDLRALKSWRDGQLNLAHGPETKNNEKIKIKNRVAQKKRPAQLSLLTSAKRKMGSLVAHTFGRYALDVWATHHLGDWFQHACTLWSKHWTFYTFWINRSKTNWYYRAALYEVCSIACLMWRPGHMFMLQLHGLIVQYPNASRREFLRYDTMQQFYVRSKANEMASLI